MNTRIAQTLTFYATAENWRSPSRGFAAQYDPEPAPVQTDAGARAREALPLAGKQTELLQLALENLREIRAVYDLHCADAVIAQIEEFNRT